MSRTFEGGRCAAAPWRSSSRRGGESPLLLGASRSVGLFCCMLLCKDAHRKASCSFSRGLDGRLERGEQPRTAAFVLVERLGDGELARTALVATAAGIVILYAFVVFLLGLLFRALGFRPLHWRELARGRRPAASLPEGKRPRAAFPQAIP